MCVKLFDNLYAAEDVKFFNENNESQWEALTLEQRYWMVKLDKGDFLDDLKSWGYDVSDERMLEAMKEASRWSAIDGILWHHGNAKERKVRCSCR